MTPFELTTLITILANVMAEDLDTTQLNFVSVLFQQLADTLATIALQRENGEAAQNKENAIDDER